MTDQAHTEQTTDAPTAAPTDAPTAAPTQTEVETAPDAPTDVPVQAEGVTASDAPVQATPDAPVQATPDAESIDSPEVADALEGTDSPEVADALEGAGSPEGKSATPAARRLEEEGDVAADYLEELLDIADLDGDIDIDVENGRASVSVVGDEASTVSLRRLAGRDGAVLEALQELTRLAVQAKTGERTRLMLDVAGFRAARKAELETLARRAAEDVKTSGEALRLDPMTPFERKVVHDAIAAAGLSSDSEGVEPARRVVVRPS